MSDDAINTEGTALGIELGSTRIKAVLIGPDHQPLASGSHSWENQFVDRLWTYSLESVTEGLQACFASLAEQVEKRYDTTLTTVGAIGISAMMHGYLAFDAEDELLVPFRTWRNTNTAQAADALTEALGANIPHRWSAAHLYQAVLNGEDHVGRLARITTLAGYVHGLLSDTRVLGVGDASGMFPIDVGAGDYDAELLQTFDRLVADAGAELTLRPLLPDIATAGADAGRLTAAGAALLDPSGALQPGALMCPPEGDAGTGMVATNSVAPRTGNVSAGTSFFAMVVLEQPLARAHRELDVVTTPAGDAVAMVHCNNGASELNAWAGLFAEFATALGVSTDQGQVFQTLFTAALDGASDCAGLMAFNYLAGEPITGLDEGRPLFVRSPESSLDLGTFIRTQLFASLATMKIGMDVLQHDEQVAVDTMYAHGGLFTTKGVAQGFLAAALDTPVSVGDLAAEGGAWGIAVLAAYRAARTGPDPAASLSLQDYLTDRVFADAKLDVLDPEPDDVAGFAAFIERYRAALPVQQAAVEHI